VFAEHTKRSSAQVSVQKTDANLGHQAAGKQDASLAEATAEYRDAIASHLTPADLSREQERARQWFEAHQAKPQ
jgi:hypothetical protein